MVWGYFAAAVHLRAADATLEKMLARHRFAKLLFAYANLVIGQTMLLIILSTHHFLTFMHNCSTMQASWNTVVHILTYVMVF